MTRTKHSEVLALEFIPWVTFRVRREVVTGNQHILGNIASEHHFRK
jgi:hypothetical protein